MGAGRPTKLTPAAIKKAQEYARSTYDSVKWVPTIEGLAIELDVNRDTLYAWAERDKRFSDTLEAVRRFQANKLIQHGLTGSYNPTIVKLMLANHGYVEKSEVDQNISGAVSFINDVPRPGKEAKNA